DSCAAVAATPTDAARTLMRPALAMVAESPRWAGTPSSCSPGNRSGLSYPLSITPFAFVLREAPTLSEPVSTISSRGLRVLSRARVRAGLESPSSTRIVALRAKPHSRFWLRARRTATGALLVQPTGAGAQDGAVHVGRDAHAAAIGVGNTDDGVVVGRRGAGLEGLEDGASALTRPCSHAGLGVDPHQLDAGRHLERDRRLVGERDIEEAARDRGCDMAAGALAAKRARLVVAEIDGAGQVGREA